MRRQTGQRDRLGASSADEVLGGALAVIAVIGGTLMIVTQLLF
jgi:hypothetical protein